MCVCVCVCVCLIECNHDMIESNHDIISAFYAHWNKMMMIIIFIFLLKGPNALACWNTSVTCPVAQEKTYGET